MSSAVSTPLCERRSSGSATVLPAAGLEHAGAGACCCANADAAEATSAVLTAIHFATFAGITQEDPHYTPFQYYASTLNAHHLPPSSVTSIGESDQAKHQYALSDLTNA